MQIEGGFNGGSQPTMTVKPERDPKIPDPAEVRRWIVGYGLALIAFVLVMRWENIFG